MDGHSPDRDHQICLTLLDPQESTPHHTSRRRRHPKARFPGVRPTGSFCLKSETTRPKPKQPATDPLDPTLPLNPITERSLRPGNAAAGVAFRHSTWARHREAVYEALSPRDPDRLDWIRLRDDPDAPDGPSIPGPSRRALRFADCGTRCKVLQHADDPTRYKITCNRCHDRFCLPCMQDRARLIVANLEAQLPYEKTRFMTLTLKHSKEPLQAQLDRLIGGFSTLRRWGFWQAAVTGGVAFLELKLSKFDGCWHPHLHVLLRGNYVPKELISDAWLQITGDSHIIDIRMVKSPDHLYSYLTKYVTKGWDTGMYRSPPLLEEAMNALHGRKLLIAFGSFAHVKLLLPPTAESWVELGTLHEVIQLAVSGIAWAVAAHAALFSEVRKPELCVIPPDDETPR